MSQALKHIKKAAAELPSAELERLVTWCEDLIAKRRYSELCDDTNGISHEKILKAFLKHVGGRSALKSQDPQGAAIHMQSFYEETRIRGCRIEEEADMLLLEWGPANKTEYAIACTRQIMPPTRNGSSEIRQLRLELRYPLSDELENYEGNRWCESPKKVQKFVDFTLTSAPMNLLEEKKPKKVNLTYGSAE